MDDIIFQRAAQGVTSPQTGLISSKPLPEHDELLYADSLLRTCVTSDQ